MATVAVSRDVGQEDGREVVVADAGPVEGTVEGVAAGDLLGGEVLVLAVAGDVELRAGVGLSVVLIAEAAGPANESADGCAVAGDLNVGVEDVGLVEGEGLADLSGAVGVVEGKRWRERRGCRWPRGRRALAEGGGEGGVVGVERERDSRTARPPGCVRG